MLINSPTYFSYQRVQYSKKSNCLVQHLYRENTALIKTRLIH